eukprot:CAMPEP_0181315378 /NCGR_PEP_ID=MMETSP1101-20121128/15342_1 /TAXON_ID=46948 /ORGANISM="Rhodomonas abbreviata, Strain Caron Lab Isolate" /LENGTH=135 /DNA_ID=CAMNT_0023422579 /DNA_START=8 /DNA_END=415 /DNA_ORIENTATION=-
MAARAELKKAITHLTKHFTGRTGTLTSNPEPYVQFLVGQCKQHGNADGQEAKSKLEDLRAYAFYLESMTARKAILSRFGGDEVRGISPATRNENTAERCGLKLPKLHIQDEVEDSGSKSSIRADLEDIAGTRKPE